MWDSLVPRAGVEDQALALVLLIFREEIVKPVLKPRKLLRRQCFYFICPKNAKNPLQPKPEGVSYLGHASCISLTSAACPSAFAATPAPASANLPPPAAIASNTAVQVVAY